MRTESLVDKLHVDDLDLTNKNVLMRVDFNVPLLHGQVETRRIRAAVPTIRHILRQGARLVLISHFDRPKGKVVPEMSLKPYVRHLSNMLRQEVYFAEDCIGAKTRKAVSEVKGGEVILLENLRFHKEEEENDPEFAVQLAAYGDYFINDAFGAAHRAHASTVGVTKYIHKCAAGFLMVREVTWLNKIKIKPVQPLVAVLGGSKISGKIDVIESLLDKVDKILVGGGMAFTFLKAMGFDIGRSLLEPERVDFAKNLLAVAGEKIILPSDCVVTDYLNWDTLEIGQLRTVPISQIPADCMGVDVGKQTLDEFYNILKRAKTVFWNGPLGVFELDETARGTYEMAEIMAEITEDNSALTIIGGGDSAAAVGRIGLREEMSFVSTGGGASLDLIGGKPLPGLDALTSR